MSSHPLSRSGSILGVRLFKGTFVGCDFSGLSTATLASAMSEFGLSKQTYVKPFRESDCLAAGGIWGATVDQNFDNVGSALLSLFEIATTEGWVSDNFVVFLFSLSEGHVVLRSAHHLRVQSKAPERQPSTRNWLIGSSDLSPREVKAGAHEMLVY